MKLRELKIIANIDRVLVLFIDKDGHQTKQPRLEVLPSQIAKYDEDSVVRVEAKLDTSIPSEVNGSIQVKPVLQVIVLHNEE